METKKAENIAPKIEGGPVTHDTDNTWLARGVKLSIAVLLLTLGSALAFNHYHSYRTLRKAESVPTAREVAVKPGTWKLRGVTRDGVVTVCYPLRPDNTPINVSVGTLTNGVMEFMSHLKMPVERIIIGTVAQDGKRINAVAVIHREFLKL